MTEGFPAYYGRYWICQKGNGTAVEIGRKGHAGTVHLQGEDATEAIQRVEDAFAWGRASAEGVLSDYLGD